MQKVDDDIRSQRGSSRQSRYGYYWLIQKVNQNVGTKLKTQCNKSHDILENDWLTLFHSCSGQREMAKVDERVRNLISKFDYSILWFVILCLH